MSRFFRAQGDDSSSESSSDEEELYSTEEEEEEQDEQEESSSEEDEDEDESSSDDEAGPAKKGLSRFLVDQASSESSEESDVEGTTKVKSAKDKRHDELEATISLIQNGEKINDWGSIANGLCIRACILNIVC